MKDQTTNNKSTIENQDESTELADVIPGTIQIHLYHWHNVLRPRGSMKKESVGNYLYERLIDTFDVWTDDKYGDNPEVHELVKQLEINLKYEVNVALKAFRERIEL